MARRKFWGWGNEGDGLSDPEIEQLGRLIGSRFGLTDLRLLPAPRIEDVELAAPRLSPPATLAEVFTDDRWERAQHTYGKSFADLARGLRGDYRHAPDLVAYPRTEQDVARVLEWCSSQRAAAIPFGGGSSVVGGVSPEVGEGYAGVVSIDLGRLDRVLELDRDSRAARIQAGVLGPALEAQLRPEGLTLRHFPQSFEFSSLGGWIATRSGGHYATLFTHIDEFVESLRVITPRGVYETRRLPGSGAGTDPNRLMIGSEGILGVITEAWMRLQDRPRFRANASVEFDSFEDGWRSVRDILQSGLWPANCRLLDATEALMSGSGDGSASVLIVTFESADHELDAWLARALEICREHRGQVPEAAGTSTDAEAARQGAAGMWRDAFIRGGHVADALVRLGLLRETFETAITWERFPAFHARLMEVIEGVTREQCGQAVVSCRFAFAYPDGPAPYYTLFAPSSHERQVEQWYAIKKAVSEEMIKLGGTITHHHAVGRDHRPWYDLERPPLFAEALRAAKKTLDPAGVMNPRVLIDP
ncbi:MAG TPA: FAD-binding oxidoreductase [Candidatus Dormibacteraeota bacterium]